MKMQSDETIVSKALDWAVAPCSCLSRELAIKRWRQPSSAAVGIPRGGPERFPW